MGGGKSALTLEVKLEGALGGWIVWVCESALTLEVNLGGCVLGGAGSVGANWLGGGLALTLEVKLGGGIGGISWGQIGTYFGSEFGGVWGGQICWGQIGTHFKSEFGGSSLGGADLSGANRYSLWKLSWGALGGGRLALTLEVNLGGPFWGGQIRWGANQLWGR